MVGTEGSGQKVRARGGALNFNSNGLNLNDYNDDNRNNNVSACRALPFPNFCLPFFLLFLLEAFHPAAKHSTDLIKLFLKRDIFLLRQCFYIKREPKKHSEHIYISAYVYKLR